MKRNRVSGNSKMYGPRLEKDKVKTISKKL